MGRPKKFPKGKKISVEISESLLEKLTERTKQIRQAIVWACARSIDLSHLPSDRGILKKVTFVVSEVMVDDVEAFAEYFRLTLDECVENMLRKWMASREFSPASSTAC